MGEQYVAVIECEGADWPNARVSALRMFVQEANLHFPDRLQEFIVLGVNQTVRGIWKFASPMVHPRTRKKVRLVLREEVQEVMQNLVPFDRLPATYGGNAPPIKSPEEATSLEEEVGAIAAAVWKHASLTEEPDPQKADGFAYTSCYGNRRLVGDNDQIENGC